MGISSFVHNSYHNHMFHVHLRVEGVAKTILKKFRSMDPATWKTDDLKAILSGMGIEERPEQPLRASVTVMLKGTTVISRSYDGSDSGNEGKVAAFFKKFQGIGDEFKINHQRILNAANLLQEQPSELGLPIVYGMSVTVMASLKALLKRGQNRGTFFGDVNYNLNLFTQGFSHR